MPPAGKSEGMVQVFVNSQILDVTGSIRIWQTTAVLWKAGVE